MANEYYERLSEMNPGDLADGLAMEAEFDAIAQGFSKLPTPHTGGNGFDGPVRVGDAVNNDEAVSLGQLNAAIGEAVLLPIATYGDLSAAAWGTLPSNTYLLFGTGAQFSNTPYTLVSGATYYLQVRHVIGGDGVTIYHDQLSLASTDNASNVDLRRLFVRTGSTLAAAISGGWVGFTLKKSALTALESLTPAADKMAYYTDAGAAAMTSLTAAARTLLDDASSQDMLGTMGAVGNIGTITNQDWNSILTPGVYVVSNATGLNVPPVYKYGVLLVLRPVSTVIEQIYLPNRLGGGPVIRRQSYDSGATWPDGWDGLYSRRTILGAVSLSSGIPTGGIVERGSNANGEYVKFADGTMITTTRMTLDFAVLAQNNYGTSYNLYPATFISQPSITVSRVQTTYNAVNIRWTSQVAMSSEPSRFIAYCIDLTGLSSSGGTCDYIFTAIGRWA